MNSNSERRKRFLLMMQPAFKQGVASPPSTLPPQFIDSASGNIEFYTAPLPVPTPVVIEKVVKKSELPTHDWGFFGKYEYLGVGTPYAAKTEAGTLPRNDLDAIAQMHDAQYAWTSQHTIPGSGMITNGMRGIADYGAGAAMMTASINPWSDLTLKDRSLAFVAGDVLMIQGVLRLHPATMLGMSFLDMLLY